ncbi:hypothetical protein AHF37_06589 [Paragonimus kellicotti]|nr:hypothetical protein AHF37_06589 [Paragonimus kellicotti]
MCYRMLTRAFTPASFMSRIVSHGRFYATRVCSFEEAKAAVSTLKQDPDNEIKLRMYGLFKQVRYPSVKFRLFQATSGDCSGDKPGAFNFVAKAKWQAWDSLKSMSKEDAASKYIELINDLLAKESCSPVDTADQSALTTPGLETNVNGGVMQICLNRPEKKNAITFDMYQSWTSMMNKAATDPKIKLVAITGKGDYFSSGNDLNTFTKQLETGVPIQDRVKTAREVLYQFVSAFISFPKTLVALVNGPSVGITVTTLGLYDYVLAAENAANLNGLKHLAIALFLTLVFSKEIMRARDRELLYSVNKMECDRLAERWTSPECIQAITNFLQRVK